MLQGLPGERRGGIFLLEEDWSWGGWWVTSPTDITTLPSLGSTLPGISTVPGMTPTISPSQADGRDPFFPAGSIFPF